jgi:hypothetical protein
MRPWGVSVIAAERWENGSEFHWLGLPAAPRSGRVVNDVQRLASVMRRAVNYDIAGALPSHLWRSKCCSFQRPASVRI